MQPNCIEHKFCSIVLHQIVAENIFFSQLNFELVNIESVSVLTVQRIQKPIQSPFTS